MLNVSEPSRIPHVCSGEAGQWLLETRAVGVWATIPRLAASRPVEPLSAHCDFRARRLLEKTDAPARIVTCPKVLTPEPPAGLASSWTNVNTPADLARVLSGRRCAYAQGTDR